MIDWNEWSEINWRQTEFAFSSTDVPHANGLENREISLTSRKTIISLLYSVFFWWNTITMINDYNLIDN